MSEAPPTPIPATERLWGALARPLVPAEALRAVLGLTPSEAAGLIGARVAAGREVAAFLDDVPGLLRSASITTSTSTERCFGEIRGPVLWGETLSARSATGGGMPVFVCSSNRRDYDTPANRALAATLDIVRRSAEAIDPATALALPGAVVRSAQLASSLAQHFRTHRVLRDLPSAKLAPRDLRRLAGSRRRRQLDSANAVQDRWTDPVPATAVARLADQETAAEHRLFLTAVAALHRLGMEPGPIVVRDTHLCAGPARFRHRNHGAGGGVMVGETRLALRADLPTDDVPTVVLRRAEDLIPAVKAAAGAVD